MKKILPTIFCILLIFVLVMLSLFYFDQNDFEETTGFILFGLILTIICTYIFYTTIKSNDSDHPNPRTNRSQQKSNKRCWECSTDIDSWSNISFFNIFHRSNCANTNYRLYWYYRYYHIFDNKI
jgi:uncharacterized protein YxeA